MAFFEEIIDAPMGKLANAACDEESSYKNIELNFSGFFAKRRQNTKDHWKLHGWGVPNTSQQVLNQQGLSLSSPAYYKHNLKNRLYNI